MDHLRDDREKRHRVLLFSVILLFNLLLVLMFGNDIIGQIEKNINPDPKSFTPPPTAQSPVAPSQPKQTAPSHQPLVSIPVPNEPSTDILAPPLSESPLPALPEPGPSVISSTQISTHPDSVTPSLLDINKVKDTVAAIRPEDNGPLVTNGNPLNLKTRPFHVYLAKYADGDWFAGQKIDAAGNLYAGSLVNFCAKVRDWSDNKIQAFVADKPLDIGSPELLQSRPPFIYFTGHKDFRLTDIEVLNLKKYLIEGGSIWGDNGLAGSGSRFDVAFKREMRRIIPDIDKQFVPIPADHPIYTLANWFSFASAPAGMCYTQEPLQMLSLDGKHLSILYCPNDYNDLLTGVLSIGKTNPELIQEYPQTRKSLYWPRNTPATFTNNRNIFFRNYTATAIAEVNKFYFNILAYQLVQYDAELNKDF